MKNRLERSKTLTGFATLFGVLAANAVRAEDACKSFEIYGAAQADFITDIGGRLGPDRDDAFQFRHRALTQRGYP